MRADSTAKAQFHELRPIDIPKARATAWRGSLNLASFDAILMPTLAHATTIRIQCNHTTKWLERLISQTICRKLFRFTVAEN
jgi:hypothetical protein